MSAGGPSFRQGRTRCPLLLRDPSLAAGWWRLALDTVRTALQQDSTQRQQHKEDTEKGVVVDNTVVRCASLLLPLHLFASEYCGGCVSAAGVGHA